MKKLITLVLYMYSMLNVFGQSPEKMGYQAIIRAQDNSLVANSNISLQIIVHQGTTSGVNVYQETHYISTNSNGLISVEIGTGNIVIGNFSNISWDNGPYFIETRVDINGGSNFNVINVSQLLSVPYALHAKTAEKLIAINSVNPYRAVIIPFITSRNIVSSDINNTIECTTSSTLTLSSNFGVMLIGDTINLEAHNGAILTIQAASGVTINYNISGRAIFTSLVGDVSFGLLRKSGLNSYIISGQ